MSADSKAPFTANEAATQSTRVEFVPLPGTEYVPIATEIADELRAGWSEAARFRIVDGVLEFERIN